MDTQKLTYEAFASADREWMEELTRLYGKQAADARYRPRGKGEVGSRLRALHDARETAMRAWHREADRLRESSDSELFGIAERRAP